MLQTLVTLPLLQPQHFSTGILSRHSISGVLLFGPPGTGKTMLAKAVAKSSGARFMAVALSDVFDKYVGEGEKNTRAIFTLARKLAPCVVFLDEVDALFGARRGGDGMHSSKREIINEFMSEWDGLASANRGVIVMGATNRPFDLDDAILRRMPRRVLVDLPDAAAREKILASHLRDEALAPDVSLQSLAERTVLYSGSDLKNVCISAALNSVKETVARELFEPKSTATASAPVTSFSTETHFEGALKEVPPSLTEETQTLVELRKWDDLYGEGAAKRKGAARKGWGFGIAAEAV
ncbi:P-loop containing nucleoside triphosphate hydrolase protein [Zopfochytrium polystomum]|nr:P-loop containing nucleoside triphosphate hydrolase protein [Zopfochytrium polystomum]